MKCKRCDEKEDRTDGYCSIYCRDMAGMEEEVIALKEQIEELEKEKAGKRMKFNKKEIEDLIVELCGIADGIYDDNSPHHTVLAKSMAVCRRWNSLLNEVEGQAQQIEELKAENEKMREAFR